MTTTDDEISNRILKSDRNFQIQFDFVSLIVCMKLVKNIVLVLLKSKQAKTRADLNGKRVRLKIGLMFLDEVSKTQCLDFNSML